MLNSFSQEFGTHWVAYPLPNDSSMVLFKHTYVNKQKPLKAFVSFATTGHVKVYFNERNISRDIFFSNDTPQQIAIHTVEVSRYLQKGKNTIAVWFAPYQKAPLGKQLSLDYYGILSDSTSFYHAADKDWRCTLLPNSYAHVAMSEQDSCVEVFDNTTFDTEWNGHNSSCHDWLHPTGLAESLDLPLSTSTQQIPFSAQGHRLRQILSPISCQEDSLGLHYDFGRYFYGTIRLTLRNAKKGEKIWIDGLGYTCSGEMDEQVFRHITASEQRFFTVRGDKYFKKSQIQNIEGLEIYNNSVY